MQTVTLTSRARFILTLTSLLLLGLAVPAWPSDYAESRSTLKGIPFIYVLVEDLHPDAEHDGLTRDQLQTDVELRLRKAGIRVTSSRAESPDSYLYLNVNTKKDLLPPVSGLYAFNIHLEFNQRVTLSRNRAVETLAPTWSVGSLNLVGVQRLREVRDDVADSVDKFINAYLEQNPKP